LTNSAPCGRSTSQIGLDVETKRNIGVSPEEENRRRVFGGVGARTVHDDPMGQKKIQVCQCQIDALRTRRDLAGR